jgi:exodeoxyribonuclease VII small subunit
MTNAAQPGFEESLARLEAIVERLQRDDVPLHEALALFKEGTDLGRRCDDMLNRAELEIKTLTEAIRERVAGYHAAEEDADLAEEDDI